MRVGLASAAFVLLNSCAHAEPEDMPDCSFDMNAMMSMDYEAFENDLEGGWRPLGSTKGCEVETADLLEKYRVERTEWQRRRLMHHEMQLRAAASQNDQAVSLLEAILLAEADPSMVAYHKAEIAFLSGDMPALQSARDELASLPPPAGFGDGVRRFLERFPDQEPPVWPLNLDVVDGFLNCFDKPYAEAYSNVCRQIKPPCIDDRAALLALEEDEFDQDLSGGWRAIGSVAGCEVAAADLIRDYRLGNKSARNKILYWHEGQLRASIGQTEEAIGLFKQAYHDTADEAWNYYVDATIAFLRKDRAALETAYKGLCALPRPENWDAVSADFEVKYGQTLRWPNNIGVIEGFRDCFDKAYSEAYGECNRFSASERASDGD